MRYVWANRRKSAWLQKKVNSCDHQFRFLSNDFIATTVEMFTLKKELLDESVKRNWNLFTRQWAFWMYMRSISKELNHNLRKALMWFSLHLCEKQKVCHLPNEFGTTIDSLVLNIHIRESSIQYDLWFNDMSQKSNGYSLFYWCNNEKIIFMMGKGVFYEIYWISWRRDYYFTFYEYDNVWIRWLES